MLKSIKLTNFRRHRDLQVTFGAGLSVIRAENEGGKSTLLEAISYALFGVKAIRDSIEECVTWGEAAKTLKVVLEFDVDGVAYTVSRSKSGAELSYDGGTVTGQSEVTNYVARLLRMDAGAAGRLVMSNQGEIRGALEAGAKASTELIERLAEFDQIDDLIELMQEKLTLGTPAGIESNLAAARDTLERAQEAAANSPAIDFAVHEQNMESLRAAVVEAEAAVTAAQAKQVGAEAAQGEILQRVAARRSMEARVSDTQAQVTRLQAQLARITVPADPGDVQPRVDELLAQAQAARDHADLLGIYNAGAKYLVAPSGTRSAGTEETLSLRLIEMKACERTLREDLIRTEGEIRVLRQTLLQGTCSFCGQDFSGVPEVVERNAKTTAQLDEQERFASQTKDKIAEVAADIRSELDLQEVCLPVWRALQKLQHFELADDQLPPYLKWVGPDVTTTPRDHRDIQAEARQLQESVSAYRSALAQRRTVQESLEPAEVALKEAADALAACPDIDAATEASGRDAVALARRVVDAARDQRTNARAAVDNADRAHREAQREIERARADLDGAKHNIERFERQLKELEFNNALLKRVRQVRPLVADKLWAIVLSSVSSYFSDIRGRRSKVTKTADGFEVDGHSLSSMSGSTKDSLGLAIRVALVRTFLPTSSFLLLDEPAAAMDESRTDSMLGFISTCGFGQVLLVTHEDVSQTIADHIITL